MAYNEYKGLIFIDALNVIKQKPAPDGEDIAFLRAREDYLTPEEKAIYLEGKTFAEVYGTGKGGMGGYPGALRGANDRIIVENRPLVEAQAEVRKAEEAARNAAAVANLPKTFDSMSEEQKAADKAWKEKITSANKEADLIEKGKKEEEKARILENKNRAAAEKRAQAARAKNLGNPDAE